MTDPRFFYATRLAPSDEGVFEGYAAVFNERNGHNEIVMPGAFKRTLSEHKQRGQNPPMFLHHDRSRIAGVWAEMREDAKGLLVRGSFAMKTRDGAEAFELARMGGLTGVSIGFRERGSRMDADGTLILTDIDLVEVSLVALPSAANARIKSVRNDDRGNAAFTTAALAAAQFIRGTK